MGWRRAIAGRLLGGGRAWREEEAESDLGWHAIGVGSERETPLAEQQEALASSDDAYRHNPLAFRVIELGVDFVLGKGIALRCADPAAEEWLRV